MRRALCVVLGRFLPLLLVLACGSRVNAQTRLERFELGGHYTVINLPSVSPGCAGCQVNRSGFGGRFVWNLNRFVAADSEVDFFPDEGSGATNREGGRVLIGLAGVKAGPRWNRIGLFAKLRAGVQSYGRVITGLGTAPPLTFSYGRRTNPAVDLGGVFEAYPSRRTAIRVDVSNVRIRFNTGLSTVWGNNVQVSTGMLFRF